MERLGEKHLEVEEGRPSSKPKENGSRPSGKSQWKIKKKY